MNATSIERKSGLFTRLFRRTSRTIRNARPSTATRLGLTTLEVREVPAYLSAGALVIDGTAGNDVVTVTYSAGAGLFGSLPKYTVNENGRVQTFSPFLVTAGQVRFQGGLGNDQFTNNSDLRARAEGGAGDDLLVGGWGNDTLLGGDGNDNLNGNDGNDVMDGQVGRDLLSGLGGNDSLVGGAGNDDVYGYAGNDFLDGGDGDDYVSGNDGDDQVYGRVGNDRMNGGPGNDYLEGDAGNDVMNGNEGEDNLNGGIGNDNMDGGDGRDLLSGLEGNDNLKGGAGNDDIYGYDGDDWLLGGDGDDYLGGANGKDQLYGEGGNDRVNGGTGNDILQGGQGNDLVQGQEGDDLLYGNDGNDTIRGDAGADVLSGGTGNDALYGGSELDALYGDEGHDGLFGGVGWNDVMVGGPGTDRFLVPAGDGEVITDLAVVDARINFTNADRAWMDAEIIAVDAGLGTLHGYTNNTWLLTLSTGAELTFQRVVSLGAGATPGTFTLADNNNRGLIRVADQALASNIPFVETVIHELGHNWDTEMGAADWNRWLGLSGWQPHNNGNGSLFPPPGFSISTDGQWDYRTSAGTSFHRDYGKTNPREDWSTMWEAYFRYKNGTLAAADVTRLQAKLNFIDAFMAAKRS